MPKPKLPDTRYRCRELKRRDFTCLHFDHYSSTPSWFSFEIQHGNVSFSPPSPHSPSITHSHLVCHPTFSSTPYTRESSETNSPANLHVFGTWEETSAPGGNPRGHGECANSTHTVPKVRIYWRCEGGSACSATVLPCLSGKDYL